MFYVECLNEDSQTPKVRMIKYGAPMCPLCLALVTAGEAEPCPEDPGLGGFVNQGGKKITNIIADMS